MSGPYEYQRVLVSGCWALALIPSPAYAAMTERAWADRWATWAVGR